MPRERVLEDLRGQEVQARLELGEVDILPRSRAP
jgi:hypothetical protein